MPCLAWCLLVALSVFAAPKPVVSVRAVSACGEGVLSPMEKQHPEAVAPEPTPPVVECQFERALRCVAPLPTRSAWQMVPFTQCPRTIARWSTDLVGAAPRFSRRETRARRLEVAGKGCTPTPEVGECCYVQFSTRVCD